MPSTLRAAASALVSVCALVTGVLLHGGCTGLVLGVPDAGVDGGGKSEGGGGGGLVELRVTSAGAADGASGVTLVPAFDPSIHDYYVRCAAGTNALQVSLTAPPGETGHLVEPMLTAPAQEQTVTVEVAENMAIVASVVSGTASTEYWVRCLPADFPELSMVRHPSAGTATPGYYLVGNNSDNGGGQSYAIVLDGDGVPVWYRAAGSDVFDVHAFGSNELAFFPSPRDEWTVVTTGPFSKALVSVAGLSLAPRELLALPNGHYVAIATPTVKGVDLTGLDVSLADGGTEALGPNGSILDCELVELDAKGAIVWDWRATDHFDPVKDTTFAQFANPWTAASVLDALNCDSVDVDPANGNLLVAARNMDSVFYVDRSTGRVLWKLGGAPYSKDGATYVPVASPFRRPSDARLLPGWSECVGGQVSLFDDEWLGAGPARAVVYDVALGGCDAGAASAKVAWQYEEVVDAVSCGSFRILPGGSRVIGWGAPHTPGLAFSEVDLAGRDLLDFSFGRGDWSDRAIKVPLSELDLAALRATAGLR